MNLNQKNLTFRYLLWCYKTIKEELDRIDRYYTQLPVDSFVLSDLRKPPTFKNNNAYKEKVLDFEKYMQVKKTNVDSKKFENVEKQELKVEYVYLKNRLVAIEKAIVKFLGKKELRKIINLYESEMSRRILEAREHK